MSCVWIGNETMKKAAPTVFNMQIRPIEPKDFGFIRRLAAEFPTFTIPSEYVLWFFTRFHPDHSRVIEQESGNLKAYLLAMPTSDPPNGIAIWQVAATSPNHAFALEYFTAYLHELVDLVGAKSISFTTRKDPVTLRLIRSLAKHFFGGAVAELSAVPAGQDEYEFRLSI